jgi:F-type H+-transporting ATPase subunit c
MSKRTLAIMFLAGMASAIFGEEVASAASEAASTLFAGTVIGAGLGVGLAAGGCGCGMGILIASYLQGMARQPELAGKLQMNMFVGFALIEAQVLYALFIAIILLFANPFSKYFL